MIKPDQEGFGVSWFKQSVFCYGDGGHAVGDFEQGSGSFAAVGFGIGVADAQKVGPFLGRESQGTRFHTLTITLTD